MKTILVGLIVALAVAVVCLLVLFSARMYRIILMRKYSNIHPGDKFKYVNRNPLYTQVVVIKDKTLDSVGHPWVSYQEVGDPHSPVLDVELDDFLSVYTKA